MKLVRILSDASTSRGIRLAGVEVSLPDYEADSAIHHGLAELVSATVVFPAKPVEPPNVVEKLGYAPKRKK